MKKRKVLIPLLLSLLAVFVVVLCVNLNSNKTTDDTQDLAEDQYFDDTIASAPESVVKYDADEYIMTEEQYKFLDDSLKSKAVEYDDVYVIDKSDIDDSSVGELELEDNYVIISNDSQSVSSESNDYSMLIPDTKDYSGMNAIAVIDSGASKYVNQTIDNISIFKSYTAEDNFGHGSKMINIIKSEYSDANIVSIKALTDDGTGTIANIYSAIRWAIDSNVKYINLSLSATVEGKSTLLTDVINEATEKGIAVVVSSGDCLISTPPGNISSAITIAPYSYRQRGYINNVNYYIANSKYMESSSSATAYFTSLIANPDESEYVDAVNNKFVLSHASPDLSTRDTDGSPVTFDISSQLYDKIVRETGESLDAVKSGLISVDDLSELEANDIVTANGWSTVTANLNITVNVSGEWFNWEFAGSNYEDLNGSRYYYSGDRCWSYDDAYWESGRRTNDGVDTNVDYDIDVTLHYYRDCNNIFKWYLSGSGQVKADISLGVGTGLNYWRDNHDLAGPMNCYQTIKYNVNTGNSQNYYTKYNTDNSENFENLDAVSITLYGWNISSADGQLLGSWSLSPNGMWDPYWSPYGGGVCWTKVSTTLLKYDIDATIPAASHSWVYQNSTKCDLDTRDGSNCYYDTYKCSVCGAIDNRYTTHTFGSAYWTNWSYNDEGTARTKYYVKDCSRGKHTAYLDSYTEYYINITGDNCWTNMSSGWYAANSWHTITWTANNNYHFGDNNNNKVISQTVQFTTPNNTYDHDATIDIWAMSLNTNYGYVKGFDTSGNFVRYDSRYYTLNSKFMADTWHMIAADKQFFFDGRSYTALSNTSWTYDRADGGYDFDGYDLISGNVSAYGKNSNRYAYHIPLNIYSYNTTGYYAGNYTASWWGEYVFKATSNVTFRARWIPHKYTVRFDYNSMDIEGNALVPTSKSGISGSVNYGSVYGWDSMNARTTLTDVPYDDGNGNDGDNYNGEFVMPIYPQMDGYTCIGWSSSPSSKTPEYHAGDKVKNLTKVDGSTVTLYAIWEPNTYNVTYDSGFYADNHRTETDAVKFGSAYAVKTVDNGNPSNNISISRTGYVFGGWNSSVERNVPSSVNDANGVWFSGLGQFVNGSHVSSFGDAMNPVISEKFNTSNNSYVIVAQSSRATYSPMRWNSFNSLWQETHSFDINLSAIWIPKSDTQYRVHHMYQKEGAGDALGSDNYDEVLTDTPNHFTKSATYEGTSDGYIDLQSLAWTNQSDFDSYGNKAVITASCSDTYDMADYTDGDFYNVTEDDEIYVKYDDLSSASNIRIAADGSTEIYVWHTRVIPNPPDKESDKNGVVLGNGVADVMVSPTSSIGLPSLSEYFGEYFSGEYVSFVPVLKDGYHWDFDGNNAPFAFGPDTMNDSTGRTSSRWTIMHGSMYAPSVDTSIYGPVNKPKLPTTISNESWSGKTTNESTYFRVDATNNKYTIHYDANVPSGSFSTLTGSTGDTYCLYDVDFTFANNGYNLTGYDFVGWSRTPQSYSSIDYKAGQVYTNLTDSYDLTNNDGAEITLYAVWKARTDTPYVVRHYLQNIGDGENHSTDYVLKDETRAVATTDSPLTFTTNHYTGFYPAQILTNDNGVARSVDVEPYYIGNINPRLDYNITVQVDGDGVTYVDFWYNRIYYRLGDDNFKFTYDVGNDVNGHSSTQTNHHGWYQYDENISITATMLLGYDWINWTSDTDAGIVFAKDKEYSFNMPAHNLQLTPNTKEHVFNISYDYDGGSVTVPNPTTYTVTTGAFTVNEPIKTGYTHIGWALDTDTYGLDWTNKGSWNNYSDMFGRTHYMNYTYLPGDLHTAVYTPSTIAAKLVIAPKTSSYSNPNWEGVGDRKYTAQYMAHQYYVHYDANVPDYCTSTLVGTMTDSLHTYDDYWRTPRAGAQKTLNKNTYSLMGYTFIGWNTKPDGTGEFYADEAHHMAPTGVNNQEASVARHNMTANDGEVVTLYAQWRAHEYNVVLNANDGEVTVDEANDSVLAGTPIGREADNSDIRKYINLKTGNGVIASTYDNQKRDNTVNGAIGANVANPLTTCVTLPVMNVYQEADDGLYVKDTRVSTATGVTSHFYRLADEDELADNSIQKYGIATYRRVGFNFLGWSKTPTGKNLESNQWLNDVNLNPVKLLHDGEEIKDLTANSEQVTLYAIWEPRPFTTIKAASSMYSGTMSSEVYEEKAKELNIQSVQDARSIDTSECIQQYKFTNKDSIKRTK
mgnify:CR=1 FL=1